MWEDFYVSVSEVPSFFLFSPLLSQKWWCVFLRTSLHAQLLQNLGYIGIWFGAEVHNQLSLHNMHAYIKNIVLRLRPSCFKRLHILSYFFLIHKKLWRFDHWRSSATIKANIPKKKPNWPLKQRIGKVMPQVS